MADEKMCLVIKISFLYENEFYTIRLRFYLLKSVHIKILSDKTHISRDKITI